MLSLELEAGAARCIDASAPTVGEWGVGNGDQRLSTCPWLDYMAAPVRIAPPALPVGAPTGTSPAVCGRGESLRGRRAGQWRRPTDVSRGPLELY